MAYSTVYDRPLKVARRTEHPTLDGDSVIQKLGYVETEIYRYHWITTAELQERIEYHEGRMADGWMIQGDVARTAIHEALDLYNAQITLKRFCAD